MRQFTPLPSEISLVLGEAQDEFSSTDEEDNKFPSSIKTKIKHIIKKVTEIDPDQTLATDTVNLHGQKTDETAKNLISQETEKTSTPTYACRKCGHEFSRAKTRNMHEKVCK